jgi:hypothetical protein
LVAILGRHAERSAEIQGHQPANATRTLDDLFIIVYLAAHGSLQVSVPALQAEAVDFIAAVDYAVEREQQPRQNHTFLTSVSLGTFSLSCQAALQAATSKTCAPVVPSSGCDACRVSASLAAGCTLAEVREYCGARLTSRRSFKLVGGASVDVNPRAGNTGDELLLVHKLSKDSATIFSLDAASRKITQSASPAFARPLRCLGIDKLGGCVLASRRALIPTLGDSNPPSPPGPPPDACASKCVAPCGAAGKGASGAWLASVLNVVDPCKCCKSCCANVACKAWQLCTGSTCAKDLHTCWLKSTPGMVPNAVSTSGLRLAKSDDAAAAAAPAICSNDVCCSLNGKYSGGVCTCEPPWCEPPCTHV